jgi:hypothetical protein
MFFIPRDAAICFSMPLAPTKAMEHRPQSKAVASPEDQFYQSHILPEKIKDILHSWKVRTYAGTSVIRHRSRRDGGSGKVLQRNSVV